MNPWVGEHVIPQVYSLPPRILEPAEFRRRLNTYLRWRQGSTIIADWPADFQYLLAMFVGPTFEDSWCPRFKFQLVNTPYGEPKPKFPHNALSDAIALMEWDQASTETVRTR
jgi:hypothetical protein